MSSTLLAVYIGIICAAVIVLLILLIVYLVRRWRADKNTRGLENYICVNGRVYRIVLSDEEYIAMPENAQQLAPVAPATNVVINNVVPAQSAAETAPVPAPVEETKSAEDNQQPAGQPEAVPQQVTETAPTEETAPVAEEKPAAEEKPEVEAQPVAEQPAPVPQATTINIIVAPSEGNAKAEEAPKVVSETTPAPAPSDASVPRVVVVKTENTVKPAEAREKSAESADAELDEIIKIVPREAERDAEKEHTALSDGASIFASAYKNLSDVKKKYVSEIIGYAMSMDPRAETRDFKHYRSVYLGDVPIIHVYIVKGVVRTRVPSENVEEIKVSSGGIMRSVTIPVGGVVENEQHVAENLHHIELAYSMIRGGGGPVNAEGKPADTEVEELIEIVPHVAEEDAEKEHTSLSDGASIFASAYKNLSDEKKKYVDEIINYAMSIDSKAETRDFKHYRSVYLGYVPIIHVYIVKGIVRTRLPAESVKEIKVSARGVRRIVTRPVGGVVENEQHVAENMEHIDLAYSMIRNAKVYTVEHRDGLKIGIDGDSEKK